MAQQYRNSRNAIKKSARNSIEKSLLKMPTKTIVCIVLCFLFGVLIAFSSLFLVCRNDKFVINGQKNISIIVGTEYKDEGVTIKSFGKDISNQASIKVYKDGKFLEKGLDDIDTTQEGDYQIVYSLSNLRFRNVELIRTLSISIAEPPELDAT